MKNKHYLALEERSGQNFTHSCENYSSSTDSFLSAAAGAESPAFPTAAKAEIIPGGRMPTNDRSDVMTVLSLLGSCAFMKEIHVSRGAQ